MVAYHFLVMNVSVVEAFAGGIVIDKFLKISLIIELVNCILFLSAKVYVFFVRYGIENKDAALGAALNPVNLLAVIIMKVSFVIIILIGIVIIGAGVYRWYKKNAEQAR